MRIPLMINNRPVFGPKTQYEYLEDEFEAISADGTDDLDQMLKRLDVARGKLQNDYPLPWNPSEQEIQEALDGGWETSHQLAFAMIKRLDVEINTPDNLYEMEGYEFDHANPFPSEMNLAKAKQKSSKAAIWSAPVGSQNWLGIPTLADTGEWAAEKSGATLMKHTQHDMMAQYILGKLWGFEKPLFIHDGWLPSREPEFAQVGPNEFPEDYEERVKPLRNKIFGNAWGPTSTDFITEPLQKFKPIRSHGLLYHASPWDSIQSTREIPVIRKKGKEMGDLLVSWSEEIARLANSSVGDKDGGEVYKDNREKLLAAASRFKEGGQLYAEATSEFPAPLEDDVKFMNRAGEYKEDTGFYAQYSAPGTWKGPKQVSTNMKAMNKRAEGEIRRNKLTKDMEEARRLISEGIALGQPRQRP